MNLTILRLFSFGFGFYLVLFDLALAFFNLWAYRIYSTVCANFQFTSALSITNSYSVDSFSSQSDTAPKQEAFGIM